MVGGGAIYEFLRSIRREVVGLKFEKRGSILGKKFSYHLKHKVLFEGNTKLKYQKKTQVVKQLNHNNC